MKSNATHNPALTSVFTAYLSQAGGAGFAGPVLAPAFNTAEQSASYYVFPSGNALNIPALRARAPGTKFERSMPLVSDDTFNCRNYGHETPVPDEDRRKYASAFSADKAAVERNARVIAANHERRVKALFAGAGVPSGSPTIKWGILTGDPEDIADPVADVKAGAALIRTATGVAPNTLVVSWEVFQFLQLNPKIRAQFFSNTDGVVTREMLAAIFEVKNLVVADLTLNTAPEGRAAANASVWGDDVVLAYTAAPGASLEEFSAARTFVWGGAGGGN
ncbi:MAG: hypothetical protein LBC18_08285, partial [Opitutaceae bacterium]|nr:hypothetical protein [Opitutaceae bacterium]